MKTELWQRLKSARKQAQLTQDQVAEALGISRAAVAQWEAVDPAKRTAPSRENLRRFAKSAGVPLDWLSDDLSGMDFERATLPVSPPATPEGYVRFNLFEGGAGLGLGVANVDYPEVIRTVDIAEWQIRKKLGFLPAPGRMQLITGRGPSMRPKIEDGDVVMIDTTCNYFDGDDYYLISVDGEAQIKMLQKRVDGIYVVSSNSEFREWRIDPADLVVCGKALIGLGLRRL